MKPTEDTPRVRHTGIGPPPRVREMEALGDEIALLSAQIDAALYQLLVMIREFDEAHGWDAGPCRSCAHWLNKRGRAFRRVPVSLDGGRFHRPPSSTWRTSLGLGAARERVRVARALPGLPLVSEAMRKGEISYSKVRHHTDRKP